MLSIFLGCDRLSLLPPVHPDTGRGSRLQTLHPASVGPGATAALQQTLFRLSRHLHRQMNTEYDVNMNM